MIAALPAVIPESGLSWLQVGTVYVSEFICSIQLLLENITDNRREVIDGLSLTRREIIISLLNIRGQFLLLLFLRRKTDAGWKLNTVYTQTKYCTSA